MKKILILGAGRSATSLIQFLLDRSEKYQWRVVIGEKEVQGTKHKFPDAEVIDFDIDDKEFAKKEVRSSDLVISMLPAFLHIKVAELCAEEGVNMITASYLTDDIKALGSQFESKGAMCIMEMGLDPGIDHMSAMKVLNRIKEAGGELTAFETFTGGLLAEDNSKDNPWHYKFTWNPRNVILAGTGFVKFIQNGRYKYIPYHQLFNRTEVIHIPGHGYFEGYANRDSLKYLDLYGLHNIKTLYRGTLRRQGFCKAWNIFVQLGATDDSFKMELVDQMTHRQFINSFLSYNPHDSVELKLAYAMQIGLESDEMYKLKWLGVLDDEPVGLKEGTPAQILEHILKKKWTLEKTDRDLIVMFHKFDFILDGREKQIQSHMAVVGEDDIHTGMSKSVGLPLAVTAKLIMENEIDLKGVFIPTVKELYEPVIRELSGYGFDFLERETIS
jgi:saccharopine dehydrogenase (NADP+, L-glutamate forming)